MAKKKIELEEQGEAVASLNVPLCETTSHSTRLQETAAKSLVIPNPLPPAGEGIEPVQVSVVYHAGPGEIHFCGRMWFRDLSQRATADEWAAMQAHPHFGQFDFKVKE